MVLESLILEGLNKFRKLCSGKERSSENLDLRPTSSLHLVVILMVVGIAVASLGRSAGSSHLAGPDLLLAPFSSYSVSNTLVRQFVEIAMSNKITSIPNSDH